MRALLFTTVVFLTVLSAFGREWTDSTGTYKVEAEYVGVEDGNVVLAKDGKQVSVPLERLCREDQEYVQQRLQAESGISPTSPPDPPPDPLPGSSAVETSRQKAQELYDQLVDAYLHSRWDEMAEAQKAIGRRTSLLSAEQREDLRYIRMAMAKIRPPWWEFAKSPTGASFQAEVWNLSIPVLFEPSDKGGFNFQISGGRVLINVSWNPASIESTEPATDKKLAVHGCTLGDETELAIWRTLTQSRMLGSMTPAGVIETFSANSPKRMPFEFFQEFRAKLEILKNCSPGARRMEMVCIMAGFTNPQSDTPDARTRQALGHMFLATWLEDPSKWPSVQLPRAMPADDHLLRTLAMAVKTKINATSTWTVAEDRALREAAERFCRANGQEVLESGKVTLPNGKTFVFVPAADEPFRADRDAWLKERLGSELEQ